MVNTRGVRGKVCGRRGVMACAIILAMAAGCMPKPEPLLPPPIVGRAELVRLYNDNCEKVKHLWSRAKIRARFPKQGKPGKYERHDMDGHLVIDKPDNLYLQGAVLGSPMFSIGTNKTQYWMWLKPKDDTVWIGTRKKGAGSAGVTHLALQLPEILGIYALRLEGKQTVLFTRYPEHNGIEVVDFGGKAPRVIKRMWFDRREHVPVRIDLFLPDGSCVVSARLMDYAEINGAKIARRYVVKFPTEDASLEIKLEKVDLRKKPNPKLFNPPAATNRRSLDARKDPNGAAAKE